MPTTPSLQAEYLQRLLAEGKSLLSNRSTRAIFGAPVEFVEPQRHAAWRAKVEDALVRISGRDGAFVRRLLAIRDSTAVSEVEKQVGVLAGAVDALEQEVNEPNQQEAGAMNSSNGKQGVFVSHASADASDDGGGVVDFVQMILENGLGIQPEQIFFISGVDQGIPAGQYFIPYIRDRVRNCSVLIAWITPNFLSSSFCMCELGAAWAHLPDGLIPILHNIKYDKLPSVLGTMQALAVAKKDDLNKLRAQLRTKLPSLPDRFDRWEKQRDLFYKKHG